MQYKIESPKILRGSVQLPSSKSISNRALIINALSGSEELPENISNCDDTLVTIAALREKEAKGVADIGAAGTAMRFLTAYYSVTDGIREITGTERMKNRPIGVLVEALRSLGAQIEYTEKEGFPPLRVEGKALNGGCLELPGNISSQYISALLMIGPMLRQGLKITLKDNIVSRPYIDLTLQLMEHFGVQARWTSDDTIGVTPGKYKHQPYFVESDWSGASYWYEMVALSSDKEVCISLPGLFNPSYQGDARVQEFFEKIGVSTHHHNHCAILRKCQATAGALRLDLTHQPDLAQTLAVTCAMLDRPFHLTGLQSLKIKETDRIEALRCELAKLGYIVDEANNSELFWDGERCAPLPDAAIDTYEDHRMALSFAPCALVLPQIRINDPEVVTKSYPRYWKDLEKMGFKISPRL